LQLVNVLRDVAADLRQGRCYLPRVALAEAGLQPADLLRLENEPRLRPVYDHWLAAAQAHLAAGWDYTNALPWRCARVRLACAWPVLIGHETVQKLRTNPVLDPARRVKISRAELRGVLFRSVALYGWPSRWRRLGPA
jgi:farnesyl-diphosphate farnesyltransferase